MSQRNNIWETDSYYFRNIGTKRKSNKSAIKLASMDLEYKYSIIADFMKRNHNNLLLRNEYFPFHAEDIPGGPQFTFLGFNGDPFSALVLDLTPLQFQCLLLRVKGQLSTQLRDRVLLHEIKGLITEILTSAPFNKDPLYSVFRNFDHNNRYYHPESRI